jgi:GABA permease
MLSIGGSIGARLFVGSGHAIAEAGPGAIIAYLLARRLVVPLQATAADHILNS